MKRTPDRLHSAWLLLVLTLPATLQARPVTDRVSPGQMETGTIDRNLAPLSEAGSLDTLWFGGTVWDAGSSRWEAIPGGIWAFQSGVGSAMVPPGDPDKAPGLHSRMEGWTAESVRREYFRRLTAADFAGETSVCVGAAGGLSGNASLWAGTRLADLDDEYCWPGGAGYGNNWDIAVARTFSYPGSGTVMLGFDYRNDTEAGWDSTYIEVDRDASGPAAPVVLAAYSGSLSGTASLLLSQGNGALPAGSGTIEVRFRVVSDGSYSDQDGLYPTSCGAFAVDNVALSGAIVSTSTFETDSDGWTLVPETAGYRDWSDLRSLSSLPEIVPPACGVHDSVLVFYNHNTGMIDPSGSLLVASPWIDLEAANVQGSKDILIELDVYQDFVRPERVGYDYYIQTYPVTCPSTGNPTPSRFYNLHGCFFGPDPCLSVDDCTIDGSPQRFLIGTFGASVERIRVGVIASNNCAGWGDCPGPNNDTTPYIDNIRVGVIPAGGVSDAGDSPRRPDVALRMLGRHPIVGAERTRFELAGRPGSAVKLVIVNVAGAVVRNVYQGELSDSPLTVEWDMRTDAGDRVPGGVYFARLEGDRKAVRKLVIVR